MRVVGGSARGRKLVAPPGRDTRPTSDAVREAIFNVLGSRLDLTGASALDLYAGSGALGIEAISRGAGMSVFIEKDRSAVAALRRNLEATGFGEQAEIVAGDVDRWLAKASAAAERYDLAFADPPYAFDDWSALLSLVRADLVVCESDRPIEPPLPWSVVTMKRYGATVVTLVGHLDS